MSDTPGSTVVTGSASGLGAALVALLEAEGRSVIGVDRHDADIVADLGTVDGRDAAIAEILARSGGRLDGLVSCAGLSPIHPDRGRRGQRELVRRHGHARRAAARAGRGDRTRRRSPSPASARSTAPPTSRWWRCCWPATRPWPGPRPTTAPTSAPPSATARASGRWPSACGSGPPTWGAAGVRLNGVGPGRMETPMLDGLMADPVMAAGIETFPSGIRPSRHGRGRRAGRAVPDRPRRHLRPRPGAVRRRRHRRPHAPRRDLTIRPDPT